MNFTLLLNWTEQTPNWVELNNHTIVFTAGFEFVSYLKFASFILFITETTIMYLIKPYIN